MPTSAAGRPGARNLITDVPGLKVGAAQDSRVRTGTTVILPDSPAIAAVDVRGGGPATRETDALGEDNLVQTVDALTFSGGSVYGLAAADGVAAWLGQQGRGYALRPAPACLSPLSCPPPACTIWPTVATKLAAHAAVSPTGHRCGRQGRAGLSAGHRRRRLWRHDRHG